MIRELTASEMKVVAGGFSIGSCSVDGSRTTTHDSHGNSSTSTSFHVGCGVNVPDNIGPSNNNGRNNKNGGRSSRSGVSHSNNGGGGGHR